MMSGSDSPTSSSDDPRPDTTAQAYVRFVQSLLYLGSTDAIRAAVHSMEGLERSGLREAFEEFGRFLESEGRGEERELLAHVRAAVADELEDAGRDRDSASPIETLEDLIGTALRLPNALRVRTLLLEHRDLLDGDAFHYIQSHAANPRLTSDEREQWMRLLVTAGTVARDPESRVRAYVFRGSWFRERGDFAQAERMYSRAAQLAETVDSPDVRVMALGAQGGLYRASGDYRRAITVFEKALVAATSGNNKPAVISFRKAIAQSLEHLGKHSSALDEYTALLGLLDEPYLGEERVKILLERGLVRESLGRYHAALGDYEEAADLADSMGDRGRHFIAMNNRAFSYLKRGLSRKAYHEFTQVMRTVRAWGNPVMVGSTHNNLGTVLLQMDQPAASIEHFGRALRDKINSPHKMGELISMLGMSDAKRELGDREGAEVFSTMALLPVLESGDLNLISLYASRYSGQEAALQKDMLVWALEAAREAKDRTHELVLTTILGGLYVRLGQEEKALGLYRQVIPKGGVEDPASPVQLHAQVAYARLLGKHPDSRRTALEHLNRALAAVETEIRSVLLDERRSEVVAGAIELYGALIELHTDDDRSRELMDPVAAFDLHEAAKSRSFLSFMADAPLEPSEAVPAKLLEREEQLLLAERDVQTSDELKSEVQRFRRLKELRDEIESCRAEMRPLAPEYVRLRSGEPLSFDEVRATLAACGEDVAVVSLFCDGKSTTAFAVLAERTEPRVARFPVGREDWEGAAKRLRRLFNGAPEEFPPYPPILGDRPFQRSLAFLDELCRPLARFLEELGDVELFCLAPHGPLHLIPFHALTAEDGSYLATRFGFATLPSLSASLPFLAATQTPRGPERSALIAGVSAEEDDLSEPLEADAAIFDREHWRTTACFGVAEASRRRVLDELPQHPIVHLSCHGYFDEFDAKNSGLLLSDGVRKPPRDPSSLSVLDRNRFLLRVRDLFQTRLRAQLVTLNACSTGLQGHKNAGDELDGFSRALLLSGASSVLLGLWNVDQRSSREFLRLFYDHWSNAQQPMSKWRALRHAQLEFLDSDQPHLRHPYHWAPFTLTGDWR